jgi:L-fucose isomerase-like protein
VIKPRIGSYAVYEPAEEGWEDWDQQFRQINDDLRKAGLDVVAAPEPVCDDESCKRVSVWFADKALDLLHPLIVTWSFDHYSFLIQQQNQVPMAVRSIPGIRTGSIVGCQQLGCMLTDVEVEHKLFYGALKSLDATRETAIYAKACAVKRGLQGARFAVLGPRTPGMTPVAIDELEIMRLFGATLTHVGVNEFDAMVADTDIVEAEAHWREIAASATEVSCSDEDAIASLRNYLAMKQMVREWDLKGIAVGTYPRCQGTACLPIALLNDEGIAAGCEGDVNSTIAMYILSLLTDDPVHFGEILAVDESENTIITSHSGAAAPSMVNEKGYILCPVRLAHDGVCIRFACRPGPVTFVNLVGRKGNYRMCAIEGNAVPTELIFEGNPMKIKLNSPFRRIWDAVSNYGFGSHWMAAYGHVALVLTEFCRISGIQGVFPDQHDRTA